jgi:hypothetical protein
MHTPQLMPQGARRTLFIDTVLHTLKEIEDRKDDKRKNNSESRTCPVDNLCGVSSPCAVTKDLLPQESITEHTRSPRGTRWVVRARIKKITSIVVLKCFCEWLSRAGEGI